VAGIHHAITGAINGDTVLSLNLKMYVGAQDPRDAIHVEGNPPIDLVIRGGIFGDTATVATLINAVPIVLQCPPGLKTVKDVPLPRAFATPLAGRG
jgi:4-hydroxy-tetrahydrodipicolinate reductase